MGTDDIFKTRRKRLEDRKLENRSPKANSFLIVTEGSKTEPSYFLGLSKKVAEKHGNGVSVEAPIIDTIGEGQGTVRLVQSAIQIAKKAHIMYEQQWVVFDKDDFNDFNNAIYLADRSGFHVAWSNQAFEFWLYLHFEFCDSALHRSGWVEKLDQIFKAYDPCSLGYKKNTPDIFEIVTKNGSLKNAVSFARKIDRSYSDDVLPSMRDPCTTVYRLILELKPFLEEYF